MSYCTEQNLIDRFGEQEIVHLSDRHGAGVIDSDIVTRAVGDAAGEIDGYLSARYTVPLSPVPVVLTRIACDIARWFLYEDQATDQVRDRYDRAIAFLKGVAKGEIGLGVDESGDEPSAGDGAEMQTGGHVFGRDDTGFI